MRSQRLFTNLRCNQNCTFCTFRRTADDPRAIAPATLRGEIDRARRAGVETLVLTGGEPTLRGDLPALVAYAKQQGIATVELETNATVIDTGRAEALARAGLDLARVHLPLGTDALDGITRDEGGFAAAVAGLAALRAAGIGLEIAATLVRSTAEGLPALPAMLADLLPGAALRLVVAVPAESPAPDELLTHERAAEVLSLLDAACRRVGMRAQLAQGSGPPPCVFPNRERRHHLFALSPGNARPGFSQLAACAACVVQDRCLGIADAYLQRHPETQVTPIGDDRARRRLTVVGSVAAQMERELVQTSYPSDSPPQTLVRVMFPCNQSCDFCFVSTHLPAPDDASIVEAIEMAAASGNQIILSGGEPTLHPRLADFVRLAAQHAAGRWLPQIQTNAVLLDDAARVTELVEAGLREAFVSLHGSHAAVGDAVTRAPGTYARTLRGVDNLIAAGVDVVLNFVICTLNRDDLVETVRLVGHRWPGASLNVSFVAPVTDVVPRTTALVPRYRDVLPEVDRAVAEADALGVSLVGFESMCGIPFCLLPPRLAARVPPRGFGDHEACGEFVRASACEACDYRADCWGLRRGYAAMYGVDELTALQR